MIGRVLSTVLVALSAAGAAEAGAAFPDSRLITQAHGDLINSWAKVAEGQKWELCCSTDDGCDRVNKFHEGCDGYKPTVSVARNSGGRPGKCSGLCYEPRREIWGECFVVGAPCVGLDATCGAECSNVYGDSDCTIGEPCGPSNPGNFTFGGFADTEWNGRTYGGTDASFIFGLGPEEPERFGPTGKDTNFVISSQQQWPTFGGGDLMMGLGGLNNDGGYNNPVGASGAKCNQGSTYTGSPDQICGASGDKLWGETELEVWRLAD